MGKTKKKDRAATAPAGHNPGAQPYPRLEDADLSQRVADEKAYEDELKVLQREMLMQQIRLFHNRRRAIIVFEGWDAAGKGGSIRRLTERLDPRGCHVHPIGPPTQEERSRHYLFRFFEKIPAAGTMAIFDRSWYGRVLVERVENFTSEPAWRRAYHEINEFERWLSDDGTAILKIFLHIDKKEQLKRFELRQKDPLKQWKITPDDWRNRKKWPQYENAIGDMFRETHTPNAPWVIIPANHKWFARISVLREVTSWLKRA